MSLYKKRCTKCGEEKPATLEFFSKNSRNKTDGLQPKCKQCNKKYHEENSEKIKERRKQYYKDNKQKFKEYTEKRKIEKAEEIKQYRIDNAEKRNEYSRRWRANNPEYFIEYRKKNREKINEKNRIYYLENKGAISERMRLNRLKTKEQRQEYNENHRRENPEYYANYHKNYREKNKDKRAIWWQRRRTKELSLENDFTPSDWERAKEYFNNQCAYCGVEKELTQDHFIPVSSNGGYTRDNIVPSCQSCNSKKHTSSFYEWYPSFEHYSEERNNKILNYVKKA